MGLLDAIQETDAAMEWYPAKVDELYGALSQALGLTTSVVLGTIEPDDLETRLNELFEVARGHRRPPGPDLGP